MKTKLNRRLKIEDYDITDGHHRYSKAPPASRIRLRGRWLQAAGFPPGMTVLVTIISPGVIELRLQGIQAKDGEYLIAADRLYVALAKDKEGNRHD